MGKAKVTILVCIGGESREPVSQEALPGNLAEGNHAETLDNTMNAPRGTGRQRQSI